MARSAIWRPFEWPGSWKAAQQSLSVEPLEDRTMLSGAIFVVNSTADPGDGIPNAAETTLREAIQAANATPNGTMADEILFNIPPNDPGHVYYRNNGMPGTVSIGNVTVTSVPDDSMLTDADPDWPHSWFRIQPPSALPSIMDAVVIDGLAQPGARANTLAIGSDAVLRIELDGTHAGSGASGVGVSGDGITIRGLAINRFRGDEYDDAYGIRITSGDGNVVESNYIGTDIAGLVDLGNYGGMYVWHSTNTRIGGALPAARNVISGNDSHGISFALEGHHVVQGNQIGVTALGIGALGNGGSGVQVVNSSDLMIGGLAPGADNLIAHNGMAGVAVYQANLASENNGILGNRIFENTGLGIDLGPGGVTPNDPGDGDTGANNLQNFPLLASGTASATNTTIVGSLNSTPNSVFLLHFFSSLLSDPSGFGEGKTLLGSISVTTDSQGDASFTATVPTAIPIGETFITSTATDLLGNTSEFSPAILVADSRLFDYGDAPASYETLLADDGARHAVVPTIRLGDLIDAEDDGLPGPNADGDDLDGNDDEDGVILHTPLLVGELATITVAASVDGLLNLWIDFDGDGDFADVGEQVLADQAVVHGDNPLQVLVPGTALAGDSYARFRFSTRAGLSYSGPADDGEVEDYAVRIQKPSEIHGSKWDDLDADGVRDAGEPGLAGWTIFIDQDDDGVLDIGERSTLTDANGDYAFTGLAPGPNVIAEALQPGWEQTYPSLVRGNEFQVNTETADSQDRLAIANSSSGRYLIVWTTGNENVSARIYLAGGVPLGDEFQVNQQVADTFGWDPAAAMDADGNFVVVWGAPDGDRIGVFARRFAADGTPRGDEFQVNTETAAAQIHPSVAMDASGAFVVTWFNYDRDSLDSQIYAQRYAADGTAAGAEFRINGGATTTTYPHPVAAMDGAGNFLVVWEGRGDDGTAIYARRFGADGTALSEDFQLNAITDGSRFDPVIAMRGTGEFVAAWIGTSRNEVGLDIFARRFLADGTADGAEFVVNTSLHGDQLRPSISINGQGVFVISWTSGGVARAQRYSPAGNPVGRSFEMSSRGSVNIALSDRGEIMGTWLADAGFEGLEVYARVFGMSGTQRIDLGEDVVITGIDFGNYQPAEIHGTKWNDLNGDGVIDPGDPPKAAWRVYLDYDLDNWPDTNEPSTLTDSEGNYRFLHLLTGTYAVAEVSRTGWRETFPGTAGQAGGFYGWDDFEDRLYFVDATGTITDLPAAASQPDISGLAFDSADRVLFGSSTTGELWTLDMVTGAATSLGFLPIQIERGLAYNPLDDLLYSVSDTGELIQIDPIQMTAAVVSGPGPGFGAYGVAFNPIDNRLYAVDSWQLEVYSYDAANFAGPALHASPWINWNFLLDSALTHDGTNLVMFVPAWWNNLEGDLATYDPVSGATSSLFPASLLDLPSVTAGLEFVPGIGGGAGTHLISLQAGQVSIANDFANYFYFSSISGYKYEDINENGLRDIGEPGLSGFVIYVDLDDDGVRDADEPFDSTFRGEFLIAAELPAGTYNVREVSKVGWVQTEPVSGFHTIDAFEGSRATGLLFGNRRDVDFGDAPDPTYPTLAASDGASHKIRPGFFLGAGVDHEADGQPGALADGDDGNGNDDEDGVEFLSHLARGYEAAIRVTASMPGRLDAWFDWNGDGDWDDAGEQVFDNRDLATGGNVLSLSVPTFAVNNFARFRFSRFGVQSYDGPAADGEVEDYAVQVTDLPPGIDVSVIDFSTVDVGGFNRFQIVYDIVGGFAAPFDFSFHDSVDARYGSGDTQRGSVRSIIDPQDRTAGRHTVIFGAVEYAAYLANPQTNFFLIVADAGGALRDLDYGNNDLNFVGVFHAGSPSAPAPLVVRGRDDGDRYLDEPDDLTQIRIKQSNLSLSGSLISGANVFPLASINRVIEVSAGGDDRFEASGTSPFDLFFDLNLGSGNDRADLRLVGSGTPDPTALELYVSAGLGYDEVHLTASAFPDVYFDLDLGDGNDLVTVEIPIDSLNIPGKVRELQGRIRGGTGDDVVQSCIPMSFFDVLLDYDLGDGNDVVDLDIEVAGQIIPVGENRSIHAIVLTGSGDDVVRIDVAAAPPGPPSGPQGFFDLFFDFDLGDGNDQSVTEWPSDPEEIMGKVRELHWAVDAGAGDDVVQDCDPATMASQVFIEAELGAGTDRYLLQQVTPPMGLPGPAAGHLAIDLHAGAGDDVIQMQSSGAFDVLVSHDLGTGNDAAELSFEGGGIPMSPDLTVNVLGGAGRDRINTAIAGFATSDFQAYLGAGNDSLVLTQIPHPNPSVAPVSLARAIIDGGRGIDNVMVDVEHFTIAQLLQVMEELITHMENLSASFAAASNVNRSLKAVHSLQGQLRESAGQVALRQVGNDLAIDVLGGVADDLVELTMDPAADGSVRFLAATGSGNDAVRITGSTWDNLELNVDLGNGNDTADLAIANDPLEIPGEVRELDANILAGAGDDVLVVRGDLLENSNVAIDLGNGNDTVDFVSSARTSSSAPLTLHIALDAGIGNDIVRAVASAFFEVDVQATLGAGDDQFDFVLNPNSLPAEDLTSIVYMIIDAGSGIDGVILGVEHATLEEVLESIFVMGIGQLALLALFPLGMLNMQQSIQDDRTADSQTVMSMLLDQQNLDLDVASGVSQDWISLDLDPAADGSVRFSTSTGDGDDRVLLNLPNFASADLAIDLGAGDDSANLIVGTGVQPDPTGKVRELRLNLLGGLGNDVLIADVMANSSDGISVDCDGGAGNDLIRVDYRESAVRQRPARRLYIRLVGGDGNDYLILHESLPPLRRGVVFVVDGGAGFDVAWVTARVDVVNCEQSWIYRWTGADQPSIEDLP